MNINFCQVTPKMREFLVVDEKLLRDIPESKQKSDDRIQSSGSSFEVDRTSIPTVSQDEQEKELCDLNIEVYQQEVIEKQILLQVDRVIEQENQKAEEELRLGEDNQKRSKESGDVDHQEIIEGKDDDDEKVDSNDFVIQVPEETEREKKIRLGEMTPFGTVVHSKSSDGKSYESIEEYLKNQVEMTKKKKKLKRKMTSEKCMDEKEPTRVCFTSKKSDFLVKKRVRKQPLGTTISEDFCDLQKSPGPLESETTVINLSSESEYIPSESEAEDVNVKSKSDFKKRKKSKTLFERGGKELDDGNELTYLSRIEDWERSNRRDDTEIQFRTLDDGFKVPLAIWHKLYDFQKVGVHWLWELNLQRCGGILGDEMGLGKTVQVIAFLTGLSVSQLISKHGSFKGLGPVLIVCPTTVMHQWVKEFHKWWPRFRVALLHESGTYIGKRDLLIKEIVRKNGILITSYVTCIQQSNDLLRYTWHYVVLDEGHKIRNPDSQVACTVKLLRTPHRLILSGSPMQNNLKELWSLFDFIFPGKLGTLPVFMAEFAVPITQGGYANATKVQVATAFKCATILRDTVSPYLLRRVKEDVKSHINLPPKNEQVLFCKLTDEQKELYIKYINSGKVDDMLSGKLKIFVGLIELRKICNHPDLFTGGRKLFTWDDPVSVPEEERYGYWKKAGKMVVVETLLKIWKKQGHRVVIFTQSRQMLQILESFVQSQKYEYIRMDGSTNISSRQPLIIKFNEDKKYFLFLSTTQVGGLGINLTGANRVVIYDPDWNPATDCQARERAWRIGQKNQVTIYRLVTSGTVEEKIYHRQIFKQFLTNRVLKDPRQRRFFKANDLYELFTYRDSGSSNETSTIFAGIDCEVNLKNLTHHQKIRKIKSKMHLNRASLRNDAAVHSILSKRKIEKMKKIAQSLSRKIGLEAERKVNEVVGKTVGNVSDDISNNSDKLNKSCDIISEENSKIKNAKKETVVGDAVEVRKEEVKSQKRYKDKKKKGLFEGEVVPHLEKQKTYRDVVKEATSNETDDDYILKKLFSKSEVHSALKHDQIMSEGPADYALVEGEAERVAQEAVRALKESRKAYLEAMNKSESRVLSKPRFGRKKLNQKPEIKKDIENEKNVPMSSAELLKRIQQRNGLCPIISNVSNNPLAENSELLVDIRNFISFGGDVNGKATTQQIIDKFRDRLPAGQTPLFKALLNEICVFHRNENGEGIWELRPEFQCSRRASQKDSKTFSLESQMGECESFWLVSGPPFDPRDYMISPSESDSELVKDKNLPTKKKEKQDPWNVKIDEKYLLDSQQSLRKVLELIRDGCAHQFVKRIRDLVHRFIQDSPLGFLAEDLPIVIEVVEYLSRNRSVDQEFTNLVKAIMCIAKEPPKVEKSSDVLRCKKTLIDYFTLLGELLATFDDENFQLRLLETIDCLIIRRKLVELSSVKLSFCQEALEESQLPYVVATLMETVPSNLYMYYLELALQMILISVKTGCVMLQNNVLEFVLRRLNDGKNTSEESLDVCDSESVTQDYYLILDKSSYLIWALMSIISKQSVDIPSPSENTLRSLRCLFYHESRKTSKRAAFARNNVASIIIKLYSIFKERIQLVSSGFVVDAALISVATEIGTKGTWAEKIKLGASNEDYILKELMLLCCCLLANDQKALEVLKFYKVVEGVLRLIGPNKSVPWIPSQYMNLFFTALRTLSELVPALPEVYLQSNGNNRLISALKWCMEEHFDGNSLLETLKTFCVIVTSGNESIVKDVKSQDGAKFILDLSVYLLDVAHMKIEHQNKLSRVFMVLEVLFNNDKDLQSSNAEYCSRVSLKMLERILGDLKSDSKWSPSLLVIFGGFLWEAVAWCKESLKMFVEKGGIFLLLDVIDSSSYPVQMLFLGILVDMTDEGETIGQLLTWRGKDGYGLLNTLIRIWRTEESVTKVHRTESGLIKDIESPLMTEEQWYLTHQIRNGHIFSPSIAEMMCSVRPKIHALYQFLQQRYYFYTQIGEASYSVKLKNVEPSHQVYIPLVEHYFALKMGEVWFEVLRDANISGVIPASFDGEMIGSLIQEKLEWASRIKTMQEEILLVNKGESIGEENQLYDFIKSCQLAKLLDTLKELDYVARTSFRKFQKQKKKKQIRELDESLSIIPSLRNVEIHRTFPFKTNATVFYGNYIRIKSEKEVVESDPVPLVSPVSCSETFQDYDNT